MGDGLLADRYKLVEQLAQSSSASVFKAFDETLGRSVAVKLFSPSYAQSPDFAVRFKSAAQAAASISNPHAVNLYDYGCSGEGYYLVMEYVAGSDIKQIIQTRGPLEQANVAQIASQVLEALAAAHAYNITHGAISSKNIMLQPDGNVKVMDFGVPRINTIDLLQNESSFADVKYLSPEQIRGEEPKAASDIYSLAIVMYEALTGKLPFDGPDTATIALEQLKEAPPQLADIDITIDPRLEGCIMTALDKDPAARFASAFEMRAALAAFLGGGLPMHDLSEDETSIIGTTVVPGFNYAAEKTQVYNPTDEGQANKGADLASLFDEQLPQPPKKKKKKWPIVLIVILVILGVAGFFGFRFYKSITLVPDVRTMTQADAELALTSVGFKLGTVQQESSTTIPAGSVIAQSPAANSKAPAGTAIILKVSTGPSAEDMTLVPDLSGHTAAAAEEAINAAGLTPKVGNSEYSSVDAGLVFAQNPSAGTELLKGTVVTYAISLGSRNVTVPDVLGSTQADATASLRDAGLVVEVSDDYSQTVPSGNVISQSISADTSVASSTTVAIVVSKGAKPVSQISVPNFMGMSEDAARTAAKNAGLSLHIIYITNASARPVVSDQDPEAGSMVAPGSTISVTIVKNS